MNDCLKRLMALTMVGCLALGGLTDAFCVAIHSQCGKSAPR